MTRLVALLWALAVCYGDLNAGLPLVGLGVGNMDHTKIASAISKAVTQHGVKLIDTAAASNNEHLVGKALTVAAVPGVEVITKVWYTHLGYNRTMLSVRDSLKALGSGDHKVTVLLHWPECHDGMPWMHCKKEEEELPARVKAAGPIGDWRGSWKALETLYSDLHEIHRIGVSNFELHELEELLKISTVKPAVLQSSLGSFIFNPDLHKLCFENDIMYQAYDVIGTLTHYDNPAAVADLESIGESLSPPLTAAQVVQSWLVQQGIGIVPRATSDEHLKQNAPSSLKAKFDPTQMETVANAVKSLYQSEEKHDAGAEITLNVINDVSFDVNVMLVDNKTYGEVPQVQPLGPGKSAFIKAFLGQKFIARAAQPEPPKEGEDLSIVRAPFEAWHVVQMPMRGHEEFRVWRDDKEAKLAHEDGVRHHFNSTMVTELEAGLPEGRLPPGVNLSDAAGPPEGALPEEDL